MNTDHIVDIKPLLIMNFLVDGSLDHWDDICAVNCRNGRLEIVDLNGMVDVYTKYNSLTEMFQ